MLAVIYGKSRGRLLASQSFNFYHNFHYVDNAKERKIIHVDSLRWTTPNNPISKCIG